MIYQNIKRICSEKKISISKLEKDVGLGNGTVGKWQTVTPRVDSIQLVAAYLGIPLAELIAERDQ